MRKGRVGMEVQEESMTFRFFSKWKYFHRDINYKQIEVFGIRLSRDRVVHTKIYKLRIAFLNFALHIEAVKEE